MPVTTEEIASVVNATAQLGMFAVVGLGVLVAWRQLDAWRREKIVTKRGELGEELVSITNEIATKIRALRSPFGYGPPEGEEDDGTYDYQRRLRELAEIDPEFNKLRQLKVRARAILSEDDIPEALDAIFEARTQLIIALRGKIMMIRRNATSFGALVNEQHYERENRYDGIIWEDYGDRDDPIRALLDPAIAKVEDRMIPYVRLEVAK